MHKQYVLEQILYGFKCFLLYKAYFSSSITFSFIRKFESGKNVSNLELIHCTVGYGGVMRKDIDLELLKKQFLSYRS